MGYDLVSRPLPGVQLDRLHPLSRGLIGCYLLNEGAGTRVKDIASGNDGILTDISPQICWQGSSHGYTADFQTSTTQRISSIQNLVLGSAPRTISCWVYPRANTGDLGVFHSGTTNAGQMHSLLIRSDQWYYSKWGADLASVGGVALNQWTHIVCMWESPGTNGMRIYVNGVLNAQTTTGAFTTSATPFDIGRYGVFTGTNSLNGSIRNVLIYNRAISPDEVKQLYQTPYAMLDIFPLPLSLILPKLRLVIKTKYNAGGRLRLGVRTQYSSIDKFRKTIRTTYNSVSMFRKTIRTMYNSVPMFRKTIRTMYNSVPMFRKIIRTAYQSVPMLRKLLHTKYQSVPTLRKLLRTTYSSSSIVRKIIQTKYHASTIRANWLFKTIYSGTQAVRWLFRTKYHGSEGVVQWYNVNDSLLVDLALPDVQKGQISATTILHLWNAKGITTGTLTMTNCRVSAATQTGVYSGGTDLEGQEVITEKWAEVKSNGVSGTGITDDAQVGFTPIGGDPNVAGNYLAIGNIPPNTARHIHVRVNVPATPTTSFNAFPELLISHDMI